MSGLKGTTNNRFMPNRTFTVINGSGFAQKLAQVKGVVAPALRMCVTKICTLKEITEYANSVFLYNKGLLLRD